MFGFANKQRYSKLTDQELLTNFKSDNWSKLKPNDRISVLQEVENRNAASQGRSPCKVGSVNSKHEYGYYSSQNNSIKVNVNDYLPGESGPVKNSSYQVLDTIYHEGQHAHQNNCVKNKIGPPQGLPETTRDLCEVENAPGVYPQFDKDGNQISGVMSYNNCTCELDSNNAAAKKVMESNDIFKDDPEYQDYLKDRERYFNQAANRDMSRVHMEQNEAVYQAYKSGDIDLKQHDNILLNEVNQKQPAFEEAKELSENIKQQRLESEQTVSNSVKDEEIESNRDIDNKGSDFESSSEDVDNSETESEDIEEEQGYRRR